MFTFRANPAPSGDLEKQDLKNAVNALHETQSKFEALVSALAPYFPDKPIAGIDGRKLLVLGRDSGSEDVELTGTAVADHPWRIQIRNNGTPESPQWQFKVNGKLRQNFNPNSVASVTNNDTWITISATSYVWIEINYNSSGGLTSATIAFGTGGWSTYPTAVTVDTTNPAAPYISRFHLLIGGIVFSGSPSVPTVGFQSARQNLRLVSGCDNGNSIRYPQEDGGAI